MKMQKLSLIILVVLVVLSLSTNYFGTTDVGDYAGVAKFFSGDYNAKIRTSHSVLYGLIHSPLIPSFESFFAMKITAIIFLILIVISVYYISHRDKRTLLLLAVSPIIWYMGPWISPIQLSSLFFLWTFYFLNKFNKTSQNKFLVYSGILAGFSWIFWNAAPFFLFFLIITFFYKKNVNSLVVFLFSILIGLLPLFIVDQSLYNFPFYSLVKFFFGAVAVSLYGSIYEGVSRVATSAPNYIAFLLMLPFYGYTLFSKKIFPENKRQIIFLTLSFLFILINPQVRYIMFLWPILIIYLGKSLNEEQFKKQFFIFIVISVLVAAPYALQIKYETNSKDFTSALGNLGNWEISSTGQDKIILQDLEEILANNPGESIVIGNHQDSYAHLAMIYWGKNIKEFVSIQDYNLYQNDEFSLFEKRVSPVPNIRERRQIWLGGGLQRPINDDTDYDSIELGIGIGAPIDLEGFELIKSYQELYLSRKTN